MKKLELFFDQKSPNLKEFLTWLAYRPSARVDLLVGNGFDAVFPANPSFDRLSPQFKSFNFDAFETSPV